MPKRGRRRGPEGVAHSTLFTPVESFRTPPTRSRWGCIFSARIPSPIGADEAGCRRGLFGAVVEDVWRGLAHTVGSPLLLSSPNPGIPFLPFSSFFLLLTHPLALAHHDGTTAVTLL
jgi:hypothetical protein